MMVVVVVVMEWHCPWFLLGLLIGVAPVRYHIDGADGWLDDVPCRWYVRVFAQGKIGGKLRIKKKR